MRAGSEQLKTVLTASQTAYLLVDILHGTDRVEQGVVPVDWELSGDLGSNVKTTGRLRFVHTSRNGESWIPEGARGVLSPFRATLLLTYVVQVGLFEERVQLGLFDVVEVPFAEDTVSHVDARWVEESTVDGGLLPEESLPPSDALIPDETVVYEYGTVVGELQRVVTSTVVVEVASLDHRVLEDSLWGPQTITGSAVEAWRKFGLLPVQVSGDATLPVTTLPAEAGSRLELVRTCADALGGVPVVNSAGNWTLTDSLAEPFTLYAWGDQSTVVEVAHEVSTVGFSNVVVGSYEAEDGTPINSVWVAPGDLSPDALGRAWVSYHRSDKVRTQDSADAATAAVGWERSSQEVDVPVVCVANPLLEIGDPITVEGWVRPLFGVAQKVDLGSGATMTVTVRTRRSFA